MTLTAEDFTTDADRWGYRTGARFVGPREWEQHCADHLNPRHFYMEPLAEALALAADDEGRIIDYRPNEFYEGPLSDVLRNEDDSPGWKLRYDRFSAMTMQVLMIELVEAGLLAHRGNGDSVDYRLTLPSGEVVA